MGGNWTTCEANCAVEFQATAFDPDMVHDERQCRRREQRPNDGQDTCTKVERCSRRQRQPVCAGQIAWFELSRKGTFYAISSFAAKVSAARMARFESTLLVIDMGIRRCGCRYFVDCSASVRQDGLASGLTNSSRFNNLHLVSSRNLPEETGQRCWVPPPRQFEPA